MVVIHRPKSGIRSPTPHTELENVLVNRAILDLEI